MTYRDIVRPEQKVIVLEPPANLTFWFLTVVGAGLLLAGIVSILFVEEFGVETFALSASGMVITALGIWVGVQRRTPTRLVLDELDVRLVHSSGRIGWWARRDEVQLVRACYQDSTDPPKYLVAVVLIGQNGELPIGVADGVSQSVPIAREVKPYLFVAAGKFSEILWLLGPRPPK